MTPSLYHELRDGVLKGVLNVRSPKIEGGYILISRQVIESEIWEKPPLYFKVWMYLLARAQYKSYKGLERGEVLVSIPELIDACSWRVGYRIEKPTKAQIFNILEWLRNSHEDEYEDTTSEPMISTTKTTRGMVVKVLNYCVYQDPSNYEHNNVHNDEGGTSTTSPQRQADMINKKEKKDKELNNKNLKDKPQKQAFEVDSPEMVLADFMLKEIRKNNPEHKTPNLQKWADEFRKIIDIDKRDKAEVSKLIRWVQSDDFEKVNVLSPTKLRTRYDNLKMKMLNPYTGPTKRAENVPEWLKVTSKEPESILPDPENVDIELERQKLLAEIAATKEKQYA